MLKLLLTRGAEHLLQTGCLLPHHCCHLRRGTGLLEQSCGDVPGLRDESSYGWTVDTHPFSLPSLCSDACVVFVLHCSSSSFRASCVTGEAACERASDLAKVSRVGRTARAMLAPPPDSCLVPCHTGVFLSRIHSIDATVLAETFFSVLSKTTQIGLSKQKCIHWFRKQDSGTAGSIPPQHPSLHLRAPWALFRGEGLACPLPQHTRVFSLPEVPGGESLSSRVLFSKGHTQHP